MQKDGEDMPGSGYWSGLGGAPFDELTRVGNEWLTALGGEAEPAAATVISAQVLDRNAIENEHAFIRRFWFDWPRSDRIGLISFKHQSDITDREIRLLKWTGNLRRKHGVVTLASARWAAIFGRCLAVCAFFEFTVFVSLGMVTTHHALSALQLLKLYGATAFVLVMLWLIYLGYIKPWSIEQRVMKMTASNAEHVVRDANLANRKVTER